MARRAGVVSGASARWWLIWSTLSLWIAAPILATGYVQIRALGGHTLPWNNGAAIEHAVLHFDLPRLLQQNVQPSQAGWLDAACYGLHASWFFLPAAFAALITVFERRRLMEYFGWMLVSAYVASAIFVVLPVTPPWMEAGTERILVARGFIPYTQLDDNPVAAFPSLHAGWPMVIALFFLFRCDRLRWAGYVAGAVSLAISFAVVYLGEHWAVDVAGGWALAAATAWAFTSSHARRQAERLPGQPLQWLYRLDRLLGDPPGRASRPFAFPEAQPDEDSSQLAA